MKLDVLDSFRLDGRVALVTGSGGAFGEVIAAGMVAKVPPGRWGDPREMAGLALYWAALPPTTSPARR